MVWVTKGSIFVYEQRKAKKRKQTWKYQNWSFLKKKQETSRKRQETPKTQHQGRNKKILWKNLPQFPRKKQRRPMNVQEFWELAEELIWLFHQPHHFAKILVKKSLFQSTWEVRRSSKSKWTKNRECCETRQSKKAGKEKRCQRVVEGMSKYACLNEWISDKLLVNCVHASPTSLRRWLTPSQKCMTMVLWLMGPRNAMKMLSQLLTVGGFVAERVSECKAAWLHGWIGQEEIKLLSVWFVIVNECVLQNK